MLYLLYGEEDLLVREELARLGDSFGEPDLLGLNTVSLDAAQLTFSDLQMHCSTIAFMAPARQVVVNGLLGRFGRPAEGGSAPAGGRGRGRARTADALAEWEPLPEFVTQMPDTTHLILVDGAIDRTNPLLALLAPHAQVKQFGKLKGAQLDGWVRDRVQRAGARFAAGVERLLLQVAGDNLRVLDNEIAKLALYANGRPITKEDIEALVPQVQESNIFQLIDNVAAGNASRAERSLHALLADGSAPPYLLFMLARQFRLLLQAKGLQQQGVKGGALQTQLGIAGFPFEKALEQERRYTMPALEHAMERLLEADIALKTGAQRGEIVLELLVLDLCREGRTAAPTRS